MGYRDDTTALDNRRQVLEREVQSMDQELSTLKQEADELRRTIARKRIKLAIYGVGNWIGSHPKTMLLFTVIIGIVLGVWIKGILKAREHRALVDAILGRDCAYQLKVDATHRAGVLVNGLDVGNVPATIPICPGTYRLRLEHSRTLPWQRAIKIPDDINSGKTLAINAPLINWRRSQRPQDGIVVFSTPPGALLFVDGKEAGRTPALLPSQRNKGTLQLALWAREEHAKVVKVKSTPAALWIHLGPGPTESRR